jgi:hypothetical protein
MTCQNSFDEIKRQSISGSDCMTAQGATPLGVPPAALCRIKSRHDSGNLYKTAYDVT